MRFPLTGVRSMRLLQISAVMTLVALALMLWALVEPTVLPVMLSMSAGQVLGATAFALYLFVIIRDLRRDRSVRTAADSLAPPLGKSVEPPPPPPPVEERA